MAGLYPGDRILELNGIKLTSIEHLKGVIQGLVDLEVPVTYRRGEHTFTTPLKFAPGVFWNPRLQFFRIGLQKILKNPDSPVQM